MLLCSVASFRQSYIDKQDRISVFAMKIFVQIDSSSSSRDFYDFYLVDDALDVSFAEKLKNS